MYPSPILCRAVCGLCAAASEQIDAPLLPPETMAEPKSVRLGFVTGVIAVEKLPVSWNHPLEWPVHFSPLCSDVHSVNAFRSFCKALTSQ